MWGHDDATHRDVISAAPPERADAAARGDLHLLGEVRAAFTGACNAVGLAGVAVLVLVLVLVRPGPDG
ncbi:hypothetical protein [Nonomuraea angiospora]|uniref:hypothetical protein n=1 Tax=Nonomuraea angiospora TaxID=46172 RepID=UPI0029A46BB3|nr:hypothetical protein [Nonomuraea angiospora]MDX3107872.1 hypothetical protein [Nonomuraea angiospora]